MANNYDKLPRVEFSVDMGNFEQAKAAAQALEEAGMTGAMAEFEREYQRALAGSKAFIRKAAADEIKKAAEKERQQVGQSKSGYVPTGTLEGSITAQFSNQDLKASIAPLATTADAEKNRQRIKSGKKIRNVHKPKKGDKDVHYYGADVEFGYGNNPKEPFMQPSGEEMIRELDGRFEKLMRHAIR
ncbi:hypothetical protein FC35_GL000917 [Limosilactobacillus coleohominis DSM 14060]|nr:hypothetical protein FC35_GL000917 [Limosilactobacillus coleohominis DSM 14060]